MTASANQPLIMEIGDRNEVPAAAEKFYVGQLAFKDASGNASGTKAAVFMGHVANPLDNSAGAAGGVLVRLIGDAHYRMKVALAAVAEIDKGKPVYASDNNTYTLTATGNTLVGVVVRKDSTGYAIVMFAPLSDLAFVNQQPVIAATKANYAAGDTGTAADIATALNTVAAAHNAVLAAIKSASVIASA